MEKVTWICGSCETENIDFRSETARPLCGGCDNDIDWDDIAHLSDDLTAYLNLIDDLSKERYGKAAVDLFEEGDAAIHSLQDSFSNCVKPEDALNLVRNLRAKELWQRFGDIPLNEGGQLKESFLHFKAGEEKLSVWRWFEKEFGLSVRSDLMYIDQNTSL